MELDLQWVSVEDKMPEFDQRVMFLTNKNNLGTGITFQLNITKDTLWCGDIVAGGKHMELQDSNEKVAYWVDIPKALEQNKDIALLCAC